MRVLAASTAGAGHFTPMKPWLARLVAAGHDVLVVGPPELAEAAGPWPFTAGDAPDHAVSHEAWERAYADPANAGTVVMTEIFARINSGALRPAMGAAMEEFRPDLVLRDPGEYASAVEAAARGVPQVRIGICLATEERLLLDYAAPVMEEWLPGATEAIDASPLLSRFPESMDPMMFADTRRYRMPSPPPRAVDRDFVYATLGTVAPIMPPLQPWFAVLAEVLSDRRGDGVLTTSHRFDPAGLDAGDNVSVQAWADHDDVLSRAAAIIHHGGSGTTLDALAAGCPQVIVPLFADQPANAEAVARVGVGAAVETGEGFALRTPPPDAAEQVRNALAEVLGSDRAATRAQEVARELAALPVLDLSLLA